MSSDVTEHQRAIQNRVQQDRESDDEQSGNKVMQAGARRYPEPPFPARAQSKPGAEVSLEPAPMWEAPYYKGSGKLAGKVAVVTGGESGIGRAVAVLFAREGTNVAFSYLDGEEVDAAVTQHAIESEGAQCLMVKTDVRERTDCQALADAAAETFGQIDVLVNNAAFQQHRKDFLDLSEEQFEMTMRTNLFGYFHMTQVALPYMPRGGAIINTGSVVGIEGSGGLIDYSITKGGIHTFTRSLSQSLLPKGIRVNAVAPGPVWTPLNPADREAEEVAEFGSQSSMGRPAQPEELAPAYVFLASSHCSSYITGEVLPVIGGY